VHGAALGHRSIFVDRCDAKARELLNERVKYREAVRPLAPLATLEAAQQCFELEQGAPGAKNFTEWLSLWKQILAR
jgi:carbamoyltransferase